MSAAPRPAAQPLPRRALLFALAPLAAAAPPRPAAAGPDPGGALKSELSLWRQEVDFYRRRLLPAPPAPSPAGGAEGGGVPLLDPGLAAFLLALPADALDALSGGGGGGAAALTASSGGGSSGVSSSGAAVGTTGGGGGGAFGWWSRPRYESDVAALTRRELRYARAAGACGGCGAAPAASSAPSGAPSGAPAGGASVGDPLSDPGWWGFLAYCRWKALAAQLPPGPRAVARSRPSALEALHGGGDAAAAAAFAEGGGGPAAAAAAPPPPAAAALGRLREEVGARLVAYARGGGGGGGAAAALASTSASLDGIRGGVRALLRVFQEQGLWRAAGVEQAGLSRDEFENQQVWIAGEPAFLKIWIRSPAFASLDDALDAEEGFAPDLFAAAVEAFLRRCGVEAEGFKRYPSYSEPGMVALQWTLRRAVPLTAEEAAVLEPAPFELDLCPGGDAMGCF
ncbi:MAG: hypothetical protein J3K34DRAFT_517268 [Monoraphidium minutum]|nr:MAG: hypothetical protein J3K34DRAFT_517268 [Monoraphidium minutum]